jgi:hypothetical protein
MANQSTRCSSARDQVPTRIHPAQSKSQIVMIAKGICSSQKELTVEDDDKTRVSNSPTHLT